jgi:hypothetical protein
MKEANQVLKSMAKIAPDSRETIIHAKSIKILNEYHYTMPIALISESQRLLKSHGTGENYRKSIRKINFQEALASR